jgi:uncharacterized protein YqeY
MATLTERLETDYKSALKGREQRRVETLRLIKAAIERVAFDKRKGTLDDQEIIQVLTQQAKQRRETIDAAKQGRRQDVLDQSTAELEIITSYLPKQLSQEELKRLIEEAVTAVGPNQGQIMKMVMGKAAGAADGKLVSQLVSERLRQASQPP